MTSKITRTLKIINLKISIEFCHKLELSNFIKVQDHFHKENLSANHENKALQFFNTGRSHLTTQPVFTYSKLTIETLEQDVKYGHSLTIETPERHQWRCSGVFIVNFEHISHLLLVFLLLTLNM